jgi:hypothetical protein
MSYLNGKLSSQATLCASMKEMGNQIKKLYSMLTFFGYSGDQGQGHFKVKVKMSCLNGKLLSQAIVYKYEGNRPPNKKVILHVKVPPDRPSLTPIYKPDFFLRKIRLKIKDLQIHVIILTWTRVSLTFLPFFLVALAIQPPIFWAGFVARPHSVYFT